MISEANRAVSNSIRILIGMDILLIPIIKNLSETHRHGNESPNNSNYYKLRWIYRRKVRENRHAAINSLISRWTVIVKLTNDAKQ